MNRTPVSIELSNFPDSLHSFLSGADIFDSSCSAEARVYFIDKDGGFYLKTAPAGTLKTEAEMTAFFHRKGLSAEVLAYETLDQDYFLTRAVPGEDCIHPQYLDDPKRLAETIGILLRKLHGIDPSGSPVTNRTPLFISAAEENHRLAKWHPSRLPQSMKHYSFDDAFTMVRQFSGELKNDTLIHGDYCLPNIMLDNWKFSGFIDVGNGGIGDRHMDLYWGCWSLNFNLKDSRWCSRFLDAYGRDLFEPEILKAVAAFEAFG